MKEYLGGLLGGMAGGGIFAIILQYFHINAEGLYVLSGLLILDFIFGIVSAKCRGEEIKSSLRQGGLVKKIMRWMLPFIVAGALSWTGMGGIETLNTVIIGMLVFAELYSIIGHIYSINYGEELPEMDAFKILLQGLVKLIKKLIKKEEEILDAFGEDEKDTLPSSNEKRKS